MLPAAYPKLMTRQRTAVRGIVIAAASRFISLYRRGGLSSRSNLTLKMQNLAFTCQSRHEKSPF
jgi:hypothetical protein